MNKNSKSNNLTVKDSLFLAGQLLQEKQIPNCQLDAELLLATTLGVDRIFLHAHPETELNKKDQQNYFKKIKQRQKRIPLAYILGYREFYGRRFLVNQDTLIPRPESENIIEMLKNSLQGSFFDSQKQLNLLDIGTGSGCLGITAKLEVPSLNVQLVDISRKALRVAKKNSHQLQADTSLLKSNLLQKIKIKPDIILANLPYVNQFWAGLSPEISHEPALALFAHNDGLSTIFNLLLQIPQKTADRCLIIIEADPRQHQTIINFAKGQSLQLEKQSNYVLVFIKNHIIAKSHQDNNQDN